MNCNQNGIKYFANRTMVLINISRNYRDNGKVYRALKWFSVFQSGIICCDRNRSHTIYSDQLSTLTSASVLSSTRSTGHDEK